MESGTSTGQGVVSTHSERESVSSCGKHRRRSASPPAPAQPFVADPSMPPLPSPHTATQLEEARRRLIEDTKSTRPRYWTSFNTNVKSCNVREFSRQLSSCNRLAGMERIDFFPFGKKGISFQNITLKTGILAINFKLL